ncbi:MAG TPA: MFS transporter [Candidatus Dormibacteraeota bacterium]
MLAVTVAVFTNLSLFLAVMPVQVARLGGSRLEVGEATALFSAGTVVCEVLTALLATRVSMARLLAIGAFAMGAGTFAYLLAGDSIPLLLALTAVRGGAFGVNAVTSSYLIAAYAAPAARGRALGAYGVAISLPSIVGASLGLLVQAAQGPWALYAVGGGVAVVAAVALVIAIERRPPRPLTAPRLRGAALPRLLPVAVVIALITMTYGALLSFGPILVAPAGAGAAPLLFLVFGFTRAASRPFAGVAVDRAGAMPVSVVAALVLAVGCAVLGAWPRGAGLLAGAALYGTGLGSISNSGYVAMLQRIEASGQALATAAWSASFDGGIMLGGAVFAVAAQARGIGAVAVLMPAVGTLAWLIVTADFRGQRPPPGKRRPAS